MKNKLNKTLIAVKEIEDISDSDIIKLRKLKIENIFDDVN